MKAYNKLFNSWIDKKYKSYKWVNIFQNQSFGANLKVKLDLFNYVTKADLKSIAGVDTSFFCYKDWFS